MKRMMMGMLSGFLFLVVASGYASADQYGCGGHPGRGGTGEGMPAMHGMMRPGGGTHEGMHFLWRSLDGIGLDEKQKEALKAVRDRVMKDTIKKRADLEVAGIELRELLTKDAVDMSAVEAKLKKNEAMRTDLRLAHIKALEEIKAILTPEQRKKLQEQFVNGFMAEGKPFGARRFSPSQESRDDLQGKPGKS